CPGGLTACNGSCVHLGTDPLNCGSCGNACAGGSVCAAGACAVSCQTGRTNCSGSCVELQTDNANCGTCGRTCPSGAACGAGQCAVTCPGGRTNCFGSCVDLATDGANCGACGTACTSGMACSAGQCTLSCPVGATRCGDSCVNLQTDDANCGACGGACAVSSTCIAGHCETPPNARGGAGQTVHSGDHVVLDASGSSDPNGDALTFQWSQTGGASISLATPDHAQTSFTAPTVTDPTRLSFKVDVGDGRANSSDHVDVMVLPVPKAADSGGCNVAGRGGSLPIWLLFAFAAFLRRRSR